MTIVCTTMLAEFATVTALSQLGLRFGQDLVVERAHLNEHCRVIMVLCSLTPEQQATLHTRTTSTYGRILHA
jgi:hypothetical protein